MESLRGAEASPDCPHNTALPLFLSTFYLPRDLGKHPHAENVLLMGKTRRALDYEGKANIIEILWELSSSPGKT